MNLIDYKPKGEIKDFPKEIIEKMLENQVEQGNDENIEVFEKDRYCGRENGGFNYYSTKEGGVFWNGVIDGYFDVFFSRYPKQEYAIEEATKTLKKYGYHVFPSDEYGIPDLSDFDGVEVEVRNFIGSKWRKEIIKCKITNNDDCVPYIAADSFLYNHIRVAKEELDFDWDCLPKWADKYIAYSNVLAWNSYDKKPNIEKELWVYGGQSCYIPNDYAPKNFKGSVKDSLFKNPKYKDEL